MKKRFSLFIAMLCALGIGAEVHITVGEPMEWSTGKLAEYIGQVVVFDDPVVVCSNRSRNLTVAPWRMFQPQCQGVAGSEEYNEAVHINHKCSFTLTGVPDPVNEPWYRCGEKIYRLKARVESQNSLTWIDGEWHGNTRADLENTDIRRLVHIDGCDSCLLVCAMNLENYFVVNYGSMGASDFYEHQAQRMKINKALTKINADIYGLIELEQGNDAIQEIVNDLNDKLPGRNYTYFTESGGTAAYQKTDLVYDANKIEPIGTPSVINTEVQNRKRMVCFREKATGEKFIYSINHFKAMSGGEAVTNSRRVNEARAVLNMYNSYRQNSNIRDNDILIMGDLNTYAKTEPVFVFTDNGMIDLHRAFHADSSYSYMFSGLASYIDHALCNETLYRQITGMAAFNINSDESDDYTYDKSNDKTMFRSSDHDPVLVGLRLDSTLVYDPSPTLNNAEIYFGEADKIIIRDAHKDGQRSFYAIYTVSGLLRERKEITSVFHEVAMPDEPGIYIVYVYSDGQVFQRKLIIK